MAQSLAATEPTTTHQPWCNPDLHVPGTGDTCVTGLPDIAGHGVYLTTHTPASTPVVNIVPADIDEGIVTLTRAQLAQVLADADAVLGGAR